MALHISFNEKDNNRPDTYYSRLMYRCDDLMYSIVRADRSHEYTNRILNKMLTAYRRSVSGKLFSQPKQNF